MKKGRVVNRRGIPLKQWSIRLPEHLADSVQLCADSVAMSVNQFVIHALAQRIRNWRSPITGELVVKGAYEEGRVKSAGQAAPDVRFDGWVCIHGSHGGMDLKARDCEYKDIPAHRNSWIREDTGEAGYNGWLLELEGLEVEDEG
jgi:hypothetical protein